MSKLSTRATSRSLSGKRSSAPWRTRLDKQTLIEVSLALTSETDLNRLLTKIITELRRLTSAEGGSLYLVMADHLRFEVAQNDYLARRGVAVSQVFQKHELPLGPGSIAGFVADTGQLLNLPDVHQLPADAPYHFDPSLDQRLHYRTQSMLAVPLKNQEPRVVGVVQLINAVDQAGQIRPFDPSDEEIVLALASQAAVAITNAQLLAQIKNLFESLVVYSVSALDARSPHTAGHSRRVAAYALALAEAVTACQEGPLAEVSFSAADLEALRFSAWLHDLGKIGVPDALLDKKAKLTVAELEAVRYRFKLAQAQAATADEVAKLEEDLDFLAVVNRLDYLPEGARERLQALAARTITLPGTGQVEPLLKPAELQVLTTPRGNLTPEDYKKIQRHALGTLQILEKLPFPGHLAQVPFLAASHHERLDGSGYPFGLKAPDLPYAARILAVVDMFDALTSTDRPYRNAYGVEKALAVLQEEADRGKLDPDLVALFSQARLYEVVLGP